MRQEWAAARRAGEALPNTVHMLCAMKRLTRTTAITLINIWPDRRITMRRPFLLIAIVIAVIFGSECISAREIHVSKTGSDSASGSLASPYLTINKAALIAMPGDTVTIHTGTCREWIKPVRGGIGENKRITYQAAPGEKINIKGSERIISWTYEADGIWKVELPNSFFGEYNPYALEISGGWLNYGKWHHRGDIYLNGEAFYEKETVQEIKEARQSWCCRAGEEVTIIHANFGKANPNKEPTEINVRESLFMPEISGLKYSN